MVEGKCSYNPLQRIQYVKAAEIDFSAKVNALLIYYKALDDNDDKQTIGTKIKLGVASFFLKKLLTDKLNEHFENMYSSLSNLQKRAGVIPDEAAMPFAILCAHIFSMGFENDNNYHSLYYFGLNIGKWIYWLDALDDYEEDKQNNNYNAWVAAGTLDRQECAKRALSALSLCANAAGMALDVMDVKGNLDILYNITNDGMVSMAARIAKGEKVRDKPLRDIGGKTIR
jgi:hypothetical protein